MEKSYAIVYLDALWVDSRQEGKSRRKSVYAAFGVNFEGKKEVLGLWIAETECSGFRASVLNEIRNRGTEDTSSIVHTMRNSTKFVGNPTGRISVSFSSILMKSAGSSTRPTD